MSRKNIAAILNRANNAVGRIAGNLVPKYRPLDYFDPIQPKNLIGTQYAAFWLNSDFNKTLEYDFQYFKAQLDSSNVLPGDIFVDTNATYLVVGSREAEGTNCIIVNDYLQINRAFYGDSGAGFGSTHTPIATNLPVNVMSMQGMPAVNVNPGHKSSQSHLLEYRIKTYFSDNLLKVGDQIINQSGYKSVIRSIEFGLLGYTLTCQEVK